MECEVELQPKLNTVIVKDEILRELKDKDLPEIIKIKATDLFNKFFYEKTHRGQKRLTLILGCIFEAYRECNEIENVYELAKIIGLSEKHVGSI